MAINEVLEALVPENARFVSGQDIFLYVPKAQTDRRYGLVKYSPSDFTIDTNGILSLLLPKSQLEDYFSEILGGSRDETVIASPKINLLNLHKTDEELYKEILNLYKTDEDLHKEDTRLQNNIDFLIQDNRDSDSTDSTYSAQKITQLIREAKMQGLHFVGYIGKELGVDEDGTSIIKEGALWHVSDSTEKPVINGSWSEDTMYKCVNGEWIKSEEYIPSDFDIWKNIDLPDSEINTWWFFDNHFEVLDFNVDMDLYYTKVQSDHRFKSNFTYGDHLYEKDGKINIDNLILPTSSKYSIFDTNDSNLTSTNVEDAIKELEDHADEEIKLINDRPVLLSYNSIPYRVGDYAVNKDGVYRSVASEDGFIWELVTEDLDNLLPRINANRYLVKGINFSNDEETGYLYSDLSVINLNNEEESNIPFSVPVATRNNDGIMPATAMRAISELDIKVEALQSGVKSYFVKFETDEPSQTALDLLYQEQSGDTGTPPNLTRLIDVSRNIYYEYYISLEDHWQGPYIYRYAVASLDQAGLVQSSEQKGQIYVEPVSGLMSLNGYTDIINTLNSLYGGEERGHIALSQVPELPTTKITSGTLDKDRLPIVPISKGGTNNSAFSAYKLVVTGNVDETDNTANSLLDGPSFGAANTVLVGQGANQLPVFKKYSESGLLPSTGGILTGAINLNSTYPQIKTNQADFVIQTAGGQQYDFTNTEFRPTASYVNTLNIGKSDRKFKDGYFSGTVKASAFDGNATSATKATQDESGNNIKASYGSALAVDGTEIKLNSKSGTSLGSITVPYATKATQDQYGLNIDTAYVRTYASRGALSEDGGSLNDLYKDNQDMRYVCTYLGLANKWTDKPENDTNGFVLETFPMRRSSTPYRTYMQKYSSRGGIWYRTGVQQTSSDAPSWTSWEKVITDTSVQTISGQKKFDEALFSIGDNDYRLPLTTPYASTNEKRYLVAVPNTGAKYTGYNTNVFMKNGILNCATPSASSNTTETATTKWVKNWLKTNPTQVFSKDISASSTAYNLEDTLTNYSLVTMFIQPNNNRTNQTIITFPTSLLQRQNPLHYVLFIGTNSYARCEITASTFKLVNYSGFSSNLGVEMYAW